MTYTLSKATAFFSQCTFQLGATSGRAHVSEHVKRILIFLFIYSIFYSLFIFDLIFFLHSYLAIHDQTRYSFQVIAYVRTLYVDFNIAIIYDIKLLHVQFIYTINYRTPPVISGKIFSNGFTHRAHKVTFCA